MDSITHRIRIQGEAMIIRSVCGMNVPAECPHLYLLPYGLSLRWDHE